MLGGDIKFGNNQTPLEISSYKPTKAKTQARTQGFFQFQMVAQGGIELPTQGFVIGQLHQIEINNCDNRKIN